MEITKRITMTQQLNYIYLITAQVGPKKLQALVRNNVQVPEQVLATMANEIIDKYISDHVTNQRGYNDTTIEIYQSKLKKGSLFEIENLHEIKLYDLMLKFHEGVIMNRTEKEQGYCKVRNEGKIKKYNEQKPEKT